MQRVHVGAAVAFLAAFCLAALVAINDRAGHSPAAVLAQKQPGYVKLHDASFMGTNRAFLHKYDGQGQSTKAPMTMLHEVRKGPVKLHQANFMGTNRAFLGKYDGEGQSTKAPMQMLHEVKKGPVKLHNAKFMGTNRAFIGKYDGQGQSTKAPMQMLHEVKKGPVKLHNAKFMGTNRAFIGKYDGQGQSTKAVRTQMLAQQGPTYVPLPPFNGMGTNAAFLGKGDGQGQSTKGRPQELYEWTADMEGTYLPADPDYAGGEVASAFGNGFLNSHVDATNLGGIPGPGPANILNPYGGYNV